MRSCRVVATGITILRTLYCTVITVIVCIPPLPVISCLYGPSRKQVAEQDYSNFVHYIRWLVLMSVKKCNLTDKRENWESK